MDLTGVLMWVMIELLAGAAAAALVWLVVQGARSGRPGKAPPKKNGHRPTGGELPLWVERSHRYEDDRLTSEQPVLQQELKDLMTLDDSTPPVTQPGKNGHGPH